MGREARARVELTNLSKSYFTEEVEIRALRDVTFRIDRGDYVAIQGPSGCGKSTLLSIIGLLDVPTAGDYRLDERSVAYLGSHERSRLRASSIGFIFQNFNLIGELPVQDNIELPLVYAGMTKRVRRERVAEVLERVHMSHRARHYPRHLSGGEQQRAAVARALVNDPILLLADEPTGNLDSKNGESVMMLMRELHEAGSTIVMVTHDARYANHADRAVHLVDGQLANDGLPFRRVGSVSR